MQNLNLYFVVFSVHNEEKRTWTGHAGYIFAKDEDSAKACLTKTYSEVNVRTIMEVHIQEGTILYGERWRQVN